MSQLPFTLRELKNAWRQLRGASICNPRNNAHRLLLFYSIECGLKAAWLKNEGKNVLDSQDISRTGHNLNKILKDLRVPQPLPANLCMSAINHGNRNPVLRKGAIEALHQVWRYGGALVSPPIDDAGMEVFLENIHKWIDKELT